MVAYSFQKAFVTDIEAEIKRHTIRLPRRRHARPGEALQLYTGMRTRHCRLIGRARCVSVARVDIELDPDVAAQVVRESKSRQRPDNAWHLVAIGVGVIRDVVVDGVPVGDLEQFAIADGFGGFTPLESGVSLPAHGVMGMFWALNHAPTPHWEGVMIRWADFQRPETSETETAE